jgi:hypothetical protein
LALIDYTFKRLTSDCNHLHAFDCGKADLNEFLVQDALLNLNELMTVTYLFETATDNPEIVAFFSVANDKLEKIEGDNNIMNKLSRLIPNNKRRKFYPSVLLARLGVNNRNQSGGLGTEIVDFIKGYFAIQNKTGCRFLLVDAYNNPGTIKFYLKNNFAFLTSKDEKEDTRFMYYDLIRSIA